MKQGTVRVCKDCEPGSKRPAPHPGPRCATHHREFKAKARDARHDTYIQKTYGLRPGEYKKILEAQGGVCFTCGHRTKRSGKRKRLATDHDHACCDAPISCGECVRGLLCGTCNKILGWLHDDIQTFLNFVEYLKNPPAKRVLNKEAEAVMGE